LSKTLGCKPAEVLAIQEVEAITCIKGSRSARGARFDLAELASQIKQLNPDSTQGFISIDQAVLIASAHGGHAGNVLAGILLNEIPFRSKPGRETLLDGSFVGREGLLTYMGKHFDSLESAHCTLQETITITGLSERELSQACKLGLIKPLGWKSTLHFLGKDIGLLLTEHISIKRWSKISGLEISSVRQHLNSQCFEACIDGALFKRTPALAATLGSLTRK
jgi:hypothetical protein